MTTYKKFKYIAIKDTPKSEHIHCDRVLTNQTYLVSKTNDTDFVSITGNLYDKNGGMDRVIDKNIHISKVKEYLKLVK